MSSGFSVMIIENGEQTDDGEKWTGGNFVPRIQFQGCTAANGHCVWQLWPGAPLARLAESNTGPVGLEESHSVGLMLWH